MKIYDEKAALKLLDGDKELLQILLNTFVTEKKFEKSILKNLFSTGNFSEATSYVHATKGAARQLCMEKLESSGQILEDTLRKKESGDISALIEQMAADYEEAIKLVKNKCTV